MKRISIIVPVYNAEKYLPEMSASLLSQDWDNLQIIFSEDGSTDASPALLQAMAADPRVTIVSGKPLGVSAARNRALAVADGDYIGFCDADDILAPGYLRRLAENLETYGADVSCCGFSRRYVASGVSDRLPVNETGITSCDRAGFFEKLLDPAGYALVIWNKLFRREALLDEKGAMLRFDETLTICEDGEFIFRSRVKKAVFTPEPLYYYMVRSSGAMYAPVSERRLTELSARKKIAEHCEDCPEEIRSLARMKYQKGVRDLMFHAVLDGKRSLVVPYFPELKTWKKELFSSPALSRKEKIKYRVYVPIIRLNLRRTGTFLMKKLGGH